MNGKYPDIANESSDAVCSTPPSVDETVTKPHRWMLHPSIARLSQPHLNANQRTSLSAMISYISHRSGISEFRVERNLSDRFHVPNPKCLPANDFDEAIRFLADIISR